MDKKKLLRILLSELAADRLAADIRGMLGPDEVEVVLARPVPGREPADIDIAYISRDVTGVSTKQVLTESLEAFYASLRASPRLQWVHTHSAGADRPIFSELAARGVKVTTSSGANAGVVAQTALAGLLALAREFPKLMREQRKHAWAPLMSGALPRDLAGQKAVIVGWGPIARQIGASLQLLGLEIAVARHSAEPAGDNIRTVVYGGLHAVLPGADWLILACPLSDSTRRLIDRGAFESLPGGARLINVARGEIVVESHLIEALQAGRLGGAYLDVFEYEPLSPDSPLWDIENVIVTPHSAGHSDGNAQRVDRMFLAYLKDWNDARPPG